MLAGSYAGLAMAEILLYIIVGKRVVDELIAIREIEHECTETF